MNMTLKVMIVIAVPMAMAFMAVFSRFMFANNKSVEHEQNEEELYALEGLTKKILHEERRAHYEFICRRFKYTSAGYKEA